MSERAHVHTRLSACKTARARSYGLGNQAQSIGNVKNHFFLPHRSSPLLFLSYLSVRFSIYVTFSLVSMRRPLVLCRSNRWLSVGVTRRQRICPVDHNHVSNRCIIMAML